MKFNYHREESICALATPWAKSAIAVIRCSGPDILKDLDGVFVPGFKRDDPNRMIFGKIKDPGTGETLDEVMGVFFASPKSYTGQDSAEFNCHGSLPGIAKILELFHKRGLREAEPGEFTYRAFLNGKLDLTRAEAVQDIVNSRTADAQSMALSRLSGVIEREINTIKDSILTISAALALSLDYPDDEVDVPDVPKEGIYNAIERIDTLLGSYNRGKLYQEGVKMALAGRTNVGKSSLYNLILREERSIVSKIHGTTRDYLESSVTIGGIPVNLYDTAGLRDSEDPVEMEGIRRSNMIVENCDLLLLVLDSTEGFRDIEKEFYGKYKEKTLLIWNKIDMEESKNVDEKPDKSIPVSAENGDGFPLLEKSIKEILLENSSSTSGGAVIDSIRQRELLESAKVSLERFLGGLKGGQPMDILSEDIRESLDALGEITGEVTRADVLDKLFSSFCVGK